MDHPAKLVSSHTHKPHPLIITIGLYMDAEAAMDYVMSRHDIDHRKVVLFGRSLGGAVAIYLAASPKYSKELVE